MNRKSTLNFSFQVIFGFGSEHTDELNSLADKSSKYYSENLEELFEYCDEDKKFNYTDKHTDLIKSVEDMIKLEKNVCIARNFNNLTKQNKKFVDVWLIHFFEKPNDVVSDPANSFAMQLGTILTMTSEWKDFKLRVFIRIMDERDRSAIVSVVERILKENRIPATVVTINFQRIYSIVQVRYPKFDF